MGYILEFNCLLRVPNDDMDLSTLQLGKTYHLVKKDPRLYPLDIPIEICDGDYKYYGKVAVRKLTLEAGTTTLDFEVVKLFDDTERDIYTRNFIKA